MVLCPGSHPHPEILTREGCGHMGKKLPPLGGKLLVNTLIGKPS